MWLEDGQFKDVVEMAVDPVCGMSVDREEALAQAEYAYEEPDEAAVERYRTLAERWVALGSEGS